MSRQKLSCTLALAWALAAYGSNSAYAVIPNALQSAYWRFEEGTPDGYVNANPPANPQTTIPDTVPDFINDNDMQAFNTATAPKYINYSLPLTPLKSGLPNALAWEVNNDAALGRDVYTNGEKIQNGIVGAKYDHDNDKTYDHDNNINTPNVPNPNATPNIASTVTGFTLEAAFNVFNYNSTRTILAKEGRPGLEQATGDDNFQALPTIALKVRGSQFADPDQGKLQVEFFDGAGNLQSVTTNDALLTGQWYYAAVVADATTVSLYLDRNDGAGYKLEGSVPVDGAIFQGLNRNDASWNYNWTIGRATYGGFEDDGFTPFKGGRPADWFIGLIDEVRLTNQALDPYNFLFAQDPIGIPGDFNRNSEFDGRDFLVWQRGFGATYDGADLADWKNGFGTAVAADGTVPEPAAFSLAAVVSAAGLLRRRRQP